MSIWKTLSAISVNEHIEKKGQFSYLSWSWCWSMVKERSPAASFKIEQDIVFPDDTVEVRMTVFIEDQQATMWLPVMDFKNNARPNPTARDISDTRMRCLVKCVAVGFGLGHYIYAGESMPQEPAEDIETALFDIGRADSMEVLQKVLKFNWTLYPKSRAALTVAKDAKKEQLNADQTAQ